MKSGDLKDFLIWADLAIMAGQGAEVGQRIRLFNLAKIPRKHAVEFAKTARRVGLWLVGLKVLSGFVFDANREKIVSRDPRELAEYGALLMKNGSIDEAISTLQRVDYKVLPESLLYLTFCRFARWQYTEAVEKLQLYLSCELGDYERLVAEVNLISALVILQQPDQALPLIESVLAKAKAQSKPRIMANCFELRSQLHIENGEFDLCLQDIDQAQRIFSEELTVDQIFLAKREAICHSLQQKSAEPLLRFRQLAEKKGHWESVRDADFSILKVEANRELLFYLYFGTPHAAFRQRMRSELDLSEMPNHFIRGNSSGRIVDICHLSKENEFDLKPGQLIHQLLSALLQDFYRPANYGQIFSRIFPNERFDVFTSPNRLKQLIWRFRSWAKQHSLPLSISENKGYRLSLDGEIGLKVSSKIEPESTEAMLWNCLRSHRPNLGEVSKQEVAELLSLHPARSKRLLRWAVETQRATMQKRGPKTVYILAA